MRSLLSGLYLAGCAVQDYRSRKISLRLSFLAAGTAVLMNLCLLRNPVEVLPYLAGLLPGVLLLLLAFACGGAAGTGDGICYLILGAFQGVEKVWVLLVSSLLLTSAAGGILLLAGKADGKTRLPFLTFTAAARLILELAVFSGIRW